MRNFSLRGLIVFGLLPCMFPRAGYARLADNGVDLWVAQRSELVVVGHIKKGSVEYRPTSFPWKKSSLLRKMHEMGRLSPGSKRDIIVSRYHVTLVVREVLKGKLKEKEIPIYIRGDLSVIVGGNYLNTSQPVKWSGANEPVSKNLIQILRIVPEFRHRVLAVADAGQDHIWMLRHLWGKYEKREGEETYGVRDPQDIQSLELKEYFQAYFCDNPEAEVWKYIVKHPEFTERALDRLSNEKLRLLYDRPVSPRLQKRILEIWAYRDRHLPSGVSTNSAKEIRKLSETPTGNP